MTDIVERLRAQIRPHMFDELVAAGLIGEAADEIMRLSDRNDELVDALHQIVSWSEAYPLDIFPEPDFKKANEVLKANGMTIDAISASAARHVMAGVGKIAHAALERKP